MLDKNLSELSPFEIKTFLLDLAHNSKRIRRQQGEKAAVLNGGRGNPNFFNTTVRVALNEIIEFAVSLSSENVSTPDLGYRLECEGISDKFKAYLENRDDDKKQIIFLKNLLDYVEKSFSFSLDEFVFEMSDAALGDFYPMPPRVFPCTEQVVIAYLYQILAPGHKGISFSKNPQITKHEVFATEGATMGMVYLFNSLQKNRLLKKGDHIAIMTPIFSPYLEIPELDEYQLKPVYIKAREDLGWQYSDEELEKLKDPKIKALFAVNPTNPAGMSMDHKTLEKIVEIIQTERQDLIVISDTVYATFVDDFCSLAYEAPENTICVYSYSKYFGVTGWRLGVVMMHETNVVDRLIANLPEEDKAKIAGRYKSFTLNPEKIKFIDRLEVDSRDVALAHTGGLSGPQQTLMCLVSLFELMDKERVYRKNIHNVLIKRAELLHSALGISLQDGSNYIYYYVLIDLCKMIEEKYDRAFAEYVASNYTLTDFLIRLAKEKMTVCLPGAGFDAPEWSFRISLANLGDDDYTLIGKAISELLSEIYEAWQNRDAA